MKRIVFSLALLLLAAPAQAGFLVARNGQAACVVLQSSDVTEPEKAALRELTNTLHQITGAHFKTSDQPPRWLERAIIVGPGPLAAKYFPEIDLGRFGPEEIVMRVKGRKLLLAGGRPRGTLYAVNRFLQQQCGVRWWTPWAPDMPRQATLRVSNFDVREQPAFEYRAPFWFTGFDPQWKVRNGANNEHNKIPAELGGCIQYKGFAHTFYYLVPPQKHFAGHPEWFSMIDGQRSTNRSQLCLTNPKLRDFTVERVKEWLREAPEAQIISVTQNDWYGFCQCPECKAVDDAEESQSGTMLSFANYIAEKIEPEFPHVAVDTFAYQYTRKPPKTLRARHNVIVRLCSIECNFREPLDHPSNAAFADDIRKWSKIAPRLYVWDYTTDFRNYVHPHPNWFTLGPNVRFFHEHGVRGLFEQGAYQGYGAEMSELRAWVLAQLLWNPQLNDRALIREFLDGYYGPGAARFIHQYLELMHERTRGLYLGCFLRKENYPHLNFNTLAAAERLWQQAAAVVADDEEKLARVRVSHLPVRYAILKNWQRLRRECWEQNETWPLAQSRKVVAEEFRVACQGVPGKDWTQVRVLNESRLTVDDFLKPFAEDPPEKTGPPPPVRRKNPPAPADLIGIDPARCIDIQDNLAALASPGRLADTYSDPQASDLRSVWMPGNHKEWAFQIPAVDLPPRAQTGTWKIYAAVRVRKEAVCVADSIAFTAGVWDAGTKTSAANIQIRSSEVENTFRSYLIGAVQMNPARDIWVAPAENAGIKSVWVDRIYMVPD